MKLAMTAPVLLLQKPSATSKSKEHSQRMTRRLAQWKEGRIEDLIKGRTIQKHLAHHKHFNDDSLAPLSQGSCCHSPGKITGSPRSN